MTKIKLCGLTRPCDIDAANRIGPDYVGFVFAPGSKRQVSPRQASVLKSLLSPDIPAVGVFVWETAETVAELLNRGIIDVAQLHGGEDADYLRRLRILTDKPIWQAFRVRSANDLDTARQSLADHILLDSGAGSGTVLDWDALVPFQRPYFLAGGLGPDNVAAAVRTLHPYGVDVSSGIETDGQKEPKKMAAFVAAVRKEELL